MSGIGKTQLLAWGVAAALAIVAAVRFLGGESAAEPPDVRVGGSPQGAEAAGAGEQPAGAPGAPGGPAGDGTAGGGLYVHVAGAVRRPGLYRVPAGSRVAVAIELAGGITRRAEATGVNLAAPLQDGQQIVVPSRGRAAASAIGGSGGAGAAAGSGAAGSGAAGAGAAGQGGSEKISLATATVGQLETIDGIGPTLAGRIIEYRDAHGGFRSIAELQEVDGIGEKRFQSLREAVQP